MNQYLRRKIWTLNRSGKFKGYLRTVSGYPVTLTDCMVGQPVSLAVDGNAVQDGTPTPDNPVDVQLCGDRTVNLFDKTLLKTATSTQGAGVGSTWEYNSNKIKMSTEKIYVKPNTQYTVIVYNNDIYWRDRIIESDANDICTCNHNHYTIDETYEPQKNLKVYTFVSKENTEYIIIRFMRTDCAEISYNDVTNVKCMLIEGAYTAETMPAYEPHGYKVSGQVEGLNLLSSAFEQGNIDANTGENTTNNIRIRTIDHIKCKPNTVYTIYSPYPVIGVREYDINKTYTGVWSSTVSSVTYTFTTSKNTEYLRFITQSQDGTVPDMTLPYMLVQGAYTAETMPAYEPYREPQTFNIYTPQQLAKVGDTADTVVLDFDNKTATLTNNIGDFVLTNMQAVQTSYSNDNYSSYYVVNYNFNTMGMKKDTSIVCDKLPFRRNSQSDLNGNGIGFGGNSSLLYVCISKLIASDAASVSGILEGSKCYMPLLNPITTDITALQDWDAMPSLWSGTAVITADTVIAPSAVTAKYYASKPEEVN